MFKRISSSAERVLAPATPFAYIDESCISSSQNIVDNMGNTFSCTDALKHWTDGIASGSIYINQSLINETAFSLSVIFKSANATTRYPITFGSRSENGVWLEVGNGIFRFRSNAGTLFSGVFTDMFTFGVTKSGTTFRFYLNGVFVSETTQTVNTENEITITINDTDRINNILLYKRTLTDDEMKTAFKLYFTTSGGIDHYGYPNRQQELKLEG